MKHLGLFEGIGGFSLAASWMGWETVAWCEINPFCQKVLKHHFPAADPLTDIKQTDFTKYANRIDILTGGFPCQPYSTAGKRKGKNDDRHLWPEMLRAIREIKPVWVVGENVRGLVNWNGGVVFDEVQVDLENEGYEIIPFILPACAVNSPHKRDRVWFVAYSGLQRQEKSEKPTMGVEQLFKSGAFTNSNTQGFQIDPCRKFKRISDKKEPLSQSEPSGAHPTVNGWENFPTQSPVCSGDDGIPRELDGITFSKWRNESIKAYGNAIVPQVALQIFKSIEQYILLNP